MHLVNTHISKDCTRKCLVYVDGNGHYHLKQFVVVLTEDNYSDSPSIGIEVKHGRRKFKHIESANRAVKKWLDNK